MDWDKLYPPFRNSIEQLLANCAARGAHYLPTCGWRSFEEQDRLFAQGRTTKGARVTNAKGGESSHQYGLSIDLCADLYPKKPGLQPNWNVSAYAILAEEARKLNLETGADYKSIKDWPHIGLKFQEKGLTYDILATWYRNGGLAEVWQHLDKYQW